MTQAKAVGAGLAVPRSTGGESCPGSPATQQVTSPEPSLIAQVSVLRFPQRPEGIS